MAEARDVDPQMEEDYDEEADSDFDLSGADDGSSSSSSEEQADTNTPVRPKKRRKIEKQEAPQKVEPELDSGDEATLKEAKKVRRKQRQKGEDVDEEEQDDTGWRAKTRSMREREQEEKKSSRLATIKGSTIDVDALWEKLNAPDALNLLSKKPNDEEKEQQPAIALPARRSRDPSNNEDLPPSREEDMITIKRTYNFAGETHTEEKIVPKSSAEARLWLAQRASKPQTQKVDEEGRTIQRPIRKISRFDPNFSNIDAFKGQWSAITSGRKGATGPKLNVVEKSKMDWASHVDAEGLKEELDVAAKAKDSYLHRTDFLRDVERRREDEARAARLRVK